MNAGRVLAAIDSAVAALTVDYVESRNATGVKVATPLLRRSIAVDLLRAEAALSAKGQTLLSATAASIDEALLALAEARAALTGGCPQ